MHNESPLFEFFKQTPNPMCVFMGEEHRFTMVNRPYENMVNREVMGKSLREAFSTQEIGLIQKILDEVYHSGQPLHLNEIPLHLGQEVYINASYTPFLGTDGKTQGIIFHGMDVTEQVLSRKKVEVLAREVKKALGELQSEKENFRNLFRQTPEMVCILSGPKHVFEFVNEAHIKALGFDATGMEVRVAQPESVEVHGILDDVLRTGVTAHLHEIPVTVGPKLRYFNLTYAARKDENGQPNGIMILGAEVTQQVEALKARDEFISVASHELRTPLTSLKMQLQITQKKLKSDHSSNMDRAFDISLKQVDRLNSLVEDLLDISRIQSGRLEFKCEECNLSQLLRDLVERFHDQYVSARTSLEFIFPGDLMMECDPFRIEQVFTHLLSNALKYAQGKSVRVWMEEENEKVVIFFQDKGMGIAPDKLRTIFNRYERGVSNANVSGLGLGLFIAKSIVDAHQGVISVESQLQEGTTFTVALPRGKR